MVSINLLAKEIGVFVGGFCTIALLMLRWCQPTTPMPYLIVPSSDFSTDEHQYSFHFHQKPLFYTEKYRGKGWY